MSVSERVEKGIETWLNFISIPYNFFNIAVSLLFMQAAYMTTQAAALIATKESSNEVYDIVISHLKRIDTSFIHGGVSFYLYDLRFLLFIFFIEYIPFGAKAMGMLMLVRSAFINFTHVGMPQGSIPIDADITFGGDLFFSGHVANMVMLAFIFWKVRWLRYVFLFFAVLFGISAVLGHYHYTLDVCAAPFFAYGVYKFCIWAFPNDYILTVDKKTA